MANLKLTGIGKNGGFLLSNKGPLDVRTVVTEYNHLADLVSENRAYVGMLVYVNSTDKTKGLYLCESNVNDGIWKLINLDAYDDTDLITLINSKSDNSHNHSNEEIFPRQISMGGANPEICLGESDETTIEPGYIKLEDNNSVIFDVKNDYFAINNSEIVTENRLESILRETVYTKEETEDAVDNILTTINSNLEENYATKDDFRYVDEEITNHTTDKTNPHEVTAEQIGLGNVLNVASYSKTENDELLKNYALKDELFSKSYNDLTDTPKIPDLAGYATEGYVDEEVKNELAKLAETIPSIEGLATEEYVDKAIEAIPEVDLTDYALKDDLRYAEEGLTNSIDTHTKNKNNPHEVTADQIGLGNVLNVASYSKTENDELLKSYALKEELFSKSYNDLTDKPELFSGNYDDLINKPTIPEEYDDSKLRDLIDTKQENISDLEIIRTGAALGATALQSIPENYATKEDLKDFVIASDLSLIDSTVTLGTDLFSNYNVGRITGASETSSVKIGEAGWTLRQLFENIFTAKAIDPTVTLPTVTLSLSNNSSNIEYGKEVTISATITASKGKFHSTYYNNGQSTDTGVTWGQLQLVSTNSTFSDITNVTNNSQFTVSTTSKYFAVDEGETISAKAVAPNGYTSNGKVAKNNLGQDTTIKIDSNTSKQESEVDTTTISAGYIPYTYILSSGTPTDLPTSSRTSSKPSSITVSGGTANTYLYIFVPASKSDITSLSASGFDVPFNKIESKKSYVVNNNKAADYKVFRTVDPVKADTFKL